MAVASSGVYAKGSLLGSDKDWYHGQLTRVEAEQALKVSGNDCFLVRESKGALVISLTHKRVFFHVKIHYEPQQYKLDLETVNKSFPELDDLLSYYQSNAISERSKVTLGEVCVKSNTVLQEQPLGNEISTVYDRGSLLGSDKDWYHGQLTRVEAEQALTASGCDCFLIREDGRALVLSLIHHGQVHHVNIKYGPGWYALESGSAQYSFTELDELVSHYSSEPISEHLKLTLGVACVATDMPPCYETISDQVPPQFETFPETSSDLPRHYETINDSGIYSKGEPTDLIKYNWYHGNISEEQAEIALSAGTDNAFLVRHSGNKLILSYRIRGWNVHDIIHRSPEGYHLEGKEKVFRTVPGMIEHYKQFPIQKDQVLGTVAVGPRLKTRKNTKDMFKKSEKGITIKWKRCADSPVPSAVSPTVKIGDNVYVGDGLRKLKYKTTIFKYSLTHDTWSHLPDCPTLQHGLATLDDELIVIGGLTPDNLQTNNVYTFRAAKWQQVLPPMPTPRGSLSTASYENKLIIAAGGTINLNFKGETTRTDVVEIYKKDDCWYSTTRLPFQITQFTIQVIGDKCFTLGGVANSYNDCYTALYASVSSLLEHAIPADSKYTTPQIQSTWEKIPEQHPLTCPSLVELDGRLVVIGGSVDELQRRGSKFISIYDFATDTWVECKGAELPLALYRPGLVNLGNNKVMLIGGQPRSQQFSNLAFIGSYVKVVCK